MQINTVESDILDPFLATVKKTEYRSTKYRWVVLFGVMLSIINNSMAFPTLAPVAIQI